jgi:NADH-quinone oxidoreductase subunit E
VVEVECLGACCNAPMVQLNDKDYFEDLTPEKAKSLVAELRAGKAPKSGSQEGRVTSEPISGRKTLLAAAGK